MTDVQIYLKGWEDGQLYADAVNQSNHPLHDAAMPVHTASFRAYTPGDVTYHALDYTDEIGGDDLAVCERAFEMFNVGDPMRNITVRRYRNAQHRSLSVGDVVIVDGRAYTVASFGFDRVEFIAPSS